MELLRCRAVRCTMAERRQETASATGYALATVGSQTHGASVAEPLAHATQPLAKLPLDALPPFLTTSEVAGLLRTSRKAIYAMAERARLPGVTRIGRRLLVRRDDLLSWLNERRAASPLGVVHHGVSTR